MSTDVVGGSAGKVRTDPALPTAPPDIADHRYLALDALRGVAALAVLGHHLLNGRLSAPAHAEISPQFAEGGQPFASGYLAVDFFFVLSGFVLAHAYGTRLARDLTVRHFMIARLVRLQPVIVLGTLLGFALAMTQYCRGLPGAPGLWATATALPLNLMILPDVLVPWGMFLFNPPAWSLFYELLANALYALGITRWSTGVRLNDRPGSGPKLNQILAVICLVGLAGMAVSVHAGGTLDQGLLRSEWVAALARIAYSFTGGVLLQRTLGKWQPHVPRLPLPWLMLACLCVLALPASPDWRPLFDMACAAIFSPLLVMLGAATTANARWKRLAVWLGMISYPLYALHAPIMHWIDVFLALSPVPRAAVITAASLSLAWIVGRYIDPTLRRAILGSYRAGASVAPTPAPDTASIMGSMRISGNA